MTCSKLAVLNKAIQGTFFKPQKSKIDSKDTNSYLLEKSSDKQSDSWHFFLKFLKKGIWKLWINIRL